MRNLQRKEDGRYDITSSKINSTKEKSSAENSSKVTRKFQEFVLQKNKESQWQTDTYQDQ
jgi:hypothetical protein